MSIGVVLAIAITGWGNPSGVQSQETQSAAVPPSFGIPRNPADIPPGVQLPAQYAIVECHAGRNGRITDCVVVEERPEGQGLGFACWRRSPKDSEKKRLI